MGNDTVHSKKILMIKLKKKILTRSFFYQQGSANSDMISRRATYSRSVFYQQGSANSDVISCRAMYSRSVFYQQGSANLEVISRRATYFSSVFYQQGKANSDVISRRAKYSSNSNTLTTTDLNLKIRKHILITMFKSKIGVPNVKSSVTRPILMLK